MSSRDCSARDRWSSVVPGLRPSAPCTRSRICSSRRMRPTNPRRTSSRTRPTTSRDVTSLTLRTSLRTGGSCTAAILHPILYSTSWSTRPGGCLESSRFLTRTHSGPNSSRFLNRSIPCYCSSTTGAAAPPSPPVSSSKSVFGWKLRAPQELPLLLLLMETSILWGSNEESPSWERLQTTEGLV